MVQQIAANTEPDASELRRYTSWRHPFGLLRIYMHPVTASKLQARLLCAPTGDAPAELSGILLGRFFPGGQEPKVIITDFKVVNTSAVDRLAVRSNDSRTNAALTPVGFFRSDVRDASRLSAHDRAFIEQNLTDPGAIFLLLRASDTCVSVRGFFFRQNGQLQTDFNDLNIPLIIGHRATEHAIGREESRHSPAAASATRIAAGEHTAVANPSRFREHAGEAANVANTAVAPSYLTRPFQHRPLSVKALVLGCTLLLVTGLVTYLIWANGRPSRPSTVNASFTTEIGLRVQPAPAGQLEFSWNRNLPQFLAVRHAKLTILDGALRREIDMDSSQLHLGALTYIPRGADVQVELQVFLPSDRSIAESTRVVLPAPQNVSVQSAAIVNPLRAPASDGWNQRPNAALMPPKRTENPPAVQFGAYVATQTVKQPENRPESRMDQLRESSLPRGPVSRPVPSPAAVTHTDAPSETQTRTAIPNAQPQGTVAGQPSSSSPNAVPVQSSATEQVTALQSPHVIGPGEIPGQASSNTLSISPRAIAAQSPGKETRSTSVYTPPVPVREARPVVPPGVHGLITTEQLIEVRVDIDSTGKVTWARLVGSKGAVAGLLSRSALDAVRGYRFRPARRDGVPVPSTFTLTFRFVP